MRKLVGDVWRAFLAAGPIRLWAMICAAPPLTALAVWMVYLIRYAWPADRAQQQLQILGIALFGVLFLIGVIVVALAAVKVRATAPGGVSAEVDGSDDGEPKA